MIKLTELQMQQQGVPPLSPPCFAEKMLERLDDLKWWWHWDASFYFPLVVRFILIWLYWYGLFYIGNLFYSCMELAYRMINFPAVT